MKVAEFPSIAKTVIRRNSPVIDVLKFVALVGGLLWFTVQGTARLGYNWQWYRVPRYLFTLNAGHFVAGPLLEGLKVTLQITGVSLLLAFALGLTAALLRLSHSAVANWVARGYLEAIRNTPLLIQLFVMYFVLAPVLDVSRFTSAVLALSLFEGAYVAEIFRAGITSVHRSQWEAAHSLGLSIRHAYLRVILPQAIRRMLPPLTSQAISLIKDSALVSTIAIYDLTLEGQVIVSETFLTFEIWFTVAAIYLLLTVSLSLVVNTMDRRLRVEY
jgi:polar amino acid transport system permease protein